MTVIVSGIYKDGKIELDEVPKELRAGPVRVVLIEEGEKRPAQSHLVFGKYRSGILSTPESFQDAEWHGEAEFDNQYGQ